MITLDIEKPVPTFVSAGIFSEPCPSSSARYKHFVVFEFEDISFHAAAAKAKRAIQESHKFALGWLRPFLVG